MPHSLSLSLSLSSLSESERKTFLWMDIDAPAPILHWISEFGSRESVKWLLEHGASASIKDGNCNAALDWANRRKGGGGVTTSYGTQVGTEY
jgi:ankyrin repeat protein